MLRTFLAFLALAGCTSRALPTTTDAAIADAGPPPVVVVAPGAPSDAPGRFAGGDRSGAPPSIAYPADGVLVPPNLSGLEVHFHPAGHTLFEIELAQGGVPRLVVYDDCDAVGSGCVLTLRDATWAVLEDAREGGPYTLRVRGVGAAGASIGESPAITIELADEPVTGGFYFYSNEPMGVYRYDFESARPSAEPYWGPSDAEGSTCVGCHALSRDGRRMAVAFESGWGAFDLAIVDVASRRTARTVSGFVEGNRPMAAFSPDASELVIGARGMTATPPLSIVRVDGTGAAIALGVGDAPDWSPDGRTIVATGEDGALARWDRGSGGEWVAGAALTPSDGEIDLFAAFAPDSEWIAFARGASTLHSRLWAVRRDGSRPPVLLARAGAYDVRHPAGAYDSVPRFCPTTFEHQGAPLVWLTFTSNMDHGVAPFSGRWSIWMAAFQPGSTDPDPSRPAFRVPGMPTTGANRLAQWTTTIARQPCTETSECRAGEICDHGECFPDLI